MVVAPLTNNFNNGFVPLHSLWQSNREAALTLLTDFFEQFSAKYESDELPGGLDHFITRMDRQNRMTVDGIKHGTGEHTGPTSVWTSVVVKTDKDGKVSEGILTEVYPDSGAGLVTYTVAPDDKLSLKLIEFAHQETISLENKQAVDGVATEYGGKSWKSRAEKYGGTFIELGRDAPAPQGFVALPIPNYHMVPMSEDATHVPATLYVKPDTSRYGIIDMPANPRLGHVDFVNAKNFLLDYATVCYNEWKEGEALTQALADDPYLQESISVMDRIASAQENPAMRGFSDTGRRRKGGPDFTSKGWVPM